MGTAKGIEVTAFLVIFLFLVSGHLSHFYDTYTHKRAHLQCHASRICSYVNIQHQRKTHPACDEPGGMATARKARGYSARSAGVIELLQSPSFHSGTSRLWFGTNGEGGGGLER